MTCCKIINNKLKGPTQLQLLNQTEIEILTNIPLSRYTFTQTGGPAEFLAFPKNFAEVEKLVKLARADQLAITVIGNASNLIIREGGIKGLVLILTEMTQILVDQTSVTAQAGAKIVDTAFASAHAGLSGLEFAAGIPGSVGGGVFMNAGAYGGQISDVFQSAKVLLPNGQIKVLSKAEMDFAYRHSAVQENGAIVLEATFALTKGKPDAILAQMNYLNALRRYKQPLEYPSCGSVFKRPKGHFVGPMIIKAGLQGHQIGGAQVSTKHAGFIVNKGGATAQDYLDLIHLIQRTIKEQFGVDLHPEVRIIGQE